MCKDGIFVVMLNPEEESKINVGSFCNGLGQLAKLRREEVQELFKECAKGDGAEFRIAELPAETPLTEENFGMRDIARSFISSMLALFWRDRSTKSKTRIRPVA